MEYAATIWHPYKVGDTKALEKLDRRAARFVKNDYDYHSNVTEITTVMLQTSLQPCNRTHHSQIIEITIYQLNILL